MDPRRLPPVVILGATPGRVMSRRCPDCRTDDGWRVRFYIFNGEEPMPLSDVVGCTQCDARKAS